MSILITLCIVLFSISIHETGHFLAAKIFNYAIGEFSIGFGPKLLQKTKNGIMYSIRILPLGGYVSFLEKSDNKRCLYEPNPLNFVVLIMGVVFNLLLSILCIAIVRGMQGSTLFEAFYDSIFLIKNAIYQFFGSIESLGNIDNYGSVVSLVGITNNFMNISNSFKEFIMYILLVTSSLNIDFAILNLLPIPILDGGQIVINAIELTVRKKIPSNIKLAITASCWLMLIGLSVFLIGRDIVHLI